MAARFCGDLDTSKKCISTARQLVGSIFDVASIDTGTLRSFLSCLTFIVVVAMIMMSSYFELDLNSSQTAHYMNTAWSLLNLVRSISNVH